MDIKSGILILLASAVPILVLIPMQILLILKGKRGMVKGIPMAISLLLLIGSLILLKGSGILQVVAVLYCILLLILCGTGWVIASAIRKSRRP